jgi:periplasmic divalent cation tolerance protein
VLARNAIRSCAKADAGERREAQPHDNRHAGPARNANGRVEIDQRETQYNHQHSESHGGSLPGAAILVITQMPDRASALALARALVESRIAAVRQRRRTGGITLSLARQNRNCAEISSSPSNDAAIPNHKCETAIRAQHPYELPEIVAVPVVDGLQRISSGSCDETACG